MHPLVIALLVVLIPAGCGHVKKEAWEKAPLAPARVETTRLPDASGLSVDRVRFFSRTTNEARFFLALSPRTAQPLEWVIILNHGWFDRPEEMITELKADRIFAGLLAQGKVRPALLVMPDVRFDEFFRRNSDRFPFAQYLTLVAEEVAGVVSERYGVPFAREKWGVGGFSFGGFVSLDVARRYPGRFGSVSVVSCFEDDAWTFWPATPPDPGPLDSQGRGRQTVVMPGPRPRVLLACGTSDRFFSRMTRLHEKFDRLGIQHAWLTAPGGHTWKYWSSVLGPMLEFHLAGEPRR